jgi:signal transduction histidine kinase
MGEMDRLFREFDWSGTSIGPPERWPMSWRNAVRLAIDSSFPAAVALGPELLYFYNDAFIPLGGPVRHPAAIGQPVRVVWKEIWADILHPRLSHTLESGLPTGEADLMMPLVRSGYPEETYISFSFGPLRDDEGRPSGAFCVATDNTGRVIAQRQIECLRRLAGACTFAASPSDVCELAAGVLDRQDGDVPFALIYLLDSTRTRAELAGSCGLRDLPDTVPKTVQLTSEDSWGLARVIAQGSPLIVHDAHLRLGSAFSRPSLIPQQALALPIGGPTGDRVAGVMVTGLSPMRPIEESRAFHLLVGQQLEAAISNARAKERATKQAEELMELNRAKTVFLSDVSHELRTPLTLVLSPIEHLKASGRLGEADREQLDLALRAGRRLLKLIDSLLRFSRAQEGRADGHYEPVDLARLTADLCSMFRSAFEQTDVAFTVDCPQLGEPVYVDPQMWEQIALNLISNAFKFTTAGEVRVRVGLTDEGVELQVSDTGCGISEGDLSHLFERFFRGEADQARSIEGTGIGLSLVHELVKAHRGSISAKSSLGVGTIITVRIPRGKAHLPAARIRESGTAKSPGAAALPYLEEALGWISGPGGAATAPSSSEEILVVDDNADMRAHLSRLLGGRWRVSTASDGISALQRVQAHAPDLILADVMMPGLNGFDLLQALRKDRATEDIPVLLLSARAGAEASSEGLGSGADDYIVKPFSASDLLARIELHLARARAKAQARKARESAEQAALAREQFFAALFHELRTPLASLHTWIGLLRSGRLPTIDVPGALEALETSSRSLNGLVEDMLDYSAVIRGEFRVEPRSTASVATTVEEVVSAFQPVARLKSLALECDVSGPCGPVRVDDLRLQQVLWNLISNAIRYTPSGGRIAVTAGVSGGALEILVRDTGVGIAADELPHIFGRYWRGKAAGGTSGGLGLGLAIARTIVELHGGDISAQSAGVGSGATFTVRLPLSDEAVKENPCASCATEEAATRLQHAITTAAGEASRKLRKPAGEALEIEEGDLSAGHPRLSILLVEDDQGLAMACQRLLSLHGHRVIHASSCAAALMALGREKVDVIVSDAHLSDGDAVDLLAGVRRLLHDPVPERLPAVAMSAFFSRKDIARYRGAGFARQLCKPFEELALLHAVQDAFRHGSLSRHANV